MYLYVYVYVYIYIYIYLYVYIHTTLFSTTMYRHGELTIRVLIQLDLYRYCGTCAAVDHA